MNESGVSQPGDDSSTLRGVLIRLLNPVPLIALTMIFGVMFLLLCAILGVDRGHVLTDMGRPEFARGLITYLFTIVTIGTAVVLIVSALMGGSKEHFDRGKEILGLMLGVFGTMVGFYFGSELAQTSSRAKLELASPLLSASEAIAGSHLTVTTVVQGGTGPYHFGIVVGEAPPTEYDQTPGPGGWIVADIVVPDTATERAVTVTVGVLDANGDNAIARTTFTAKPKPK